MVEPLVLPHHRRMVELVRDLGHALGPGWRPTGEEVLASAIAWMKRYPVEVCKCGCPRVVYYCEGVGYRCAECLVKEITHLRECCRKSNELLRIAHQDLMYAKVERRVVDVEAARSNPSLEVVNVISRKKQMRQRVRKK